MTDIHNYILAIEDDEHMRDFIIAVLNSHRVIAVETGEQGFAQIGKARPKLVLLDLILPGISGNDVACRLSQANIPFIITSASTNWDLILQAISHGARSFVAKPFLPLELQAAVIAALQQSPPSSSLLDETAPHEDHNVTLACGILSGRFNISEQEALKMLKTNAANKNKDISLLANDIIDANDQFNTLITSLKV